MTHETPRISALWLERLALGELELTDAELESRGLERSVVEAQVAALRAENAAFDGTLPLALEREQAPETSSPWLWAAAAAVALGIGVSWWATRPSRESEPAPIAQGPVPSPAQGDRIKGGTDLYVTRQEGAEAVELRDADHAEAGDLLQLAYRAGTAQSGVIVSIDGGGATTLHFPERETDLPQLDRRGRVALNHAFELDTAPDFERFFLVTSAPGEQLRVVEVVEAARALAQSPEAKTAPLELPSDWQQLSIRLDKSN